MLEEIRKKSDKKQVRKKDGSGSGSDVGEKPKKKKPKKD